MFMCEIERRGEGEEGEGNCKRGRGGGIGISKMGLCERDWEYL
jgi:hypothetical protein